MIAFVRVLSRAGRDGNVRKGSFAPLSSRARHVRLPSNTHRGSRRAKPAA
jgi:hypothetical protein